MPLGIIIRLVVRLIRWVFESWGDIGATVSGLRFWPIRGRGWIVFPVFVLSLVLVTLLFLATGREDLLNDESVMMGTSFSLLGASLVGIGYRLNRERAKVGNLHAVFCVPVQYWGFMAFVLSVTFLGAGPKTKHRLTMKGLRGNWVQQTESEDPFTRITEQGNLNLKKEHRYESLSQAHYRFKDKHKTEINVRLKESGSWRVKNKFLKLTVEELSLEGLDAQSRTFLSQWSEGAKTLKVHRMRQREIGFGLGSARRGMVVAVGKRDEGKDRVKMKLTLEEEDLEAPIRRYSSEKSRPYSVKP